MYSILSKHGTGAMLSLARYRCLAIQDRIYSEEMLYVVYSRVLANGERQEICPGPQSLGHKEALLPSSLPAIPIEVQTQLADAML